MIFYFCMMVVCAILVAYLGITRVWELESAIKKHRDAKGDDRCWLDDYDLYSVLHDNLVETDLRLPPQAEFMANCRRFHFCRSIAETPDEALALYKAIPRQTIPTTTRPHR